MKAWGIAGLVLLVGTASLPAAHEGSGDSYEEGISRIYCGIHFRSAMNRGFVQGGRIAHYIDKTLLRPLDD